MVVNMSLHERVFEKCLVFEILEKADKIGITLVSLNIKFEHKKTKSKYVIFPINSNPDVS